MPIIYKNIFLPSLDSIIWQQEIVQSFQMTINIKTRFTLYIGITYLT